jgi:hypothetical protein
LLQVAAVVEELKDQFKLEMVVVEVQMELLDPQEEVELLVHLVL